MLEETKIVTIDEKYCNYLHQYDPSVPLKLTRPFIGTLFWVKNIMYFVPISSPKPKHKILKNKIDFLKLDNGKLGVLNLNNMIPVKESSIIPINLNQKITSSKDQKYQKLLIKQHYWIERNKNKILNKAIKLYMLYSLDVLPANIKIRCCNFPLLEQKCQLYTK